VSLLGNSTGSLVLTVLILCILVLLRLQQISFATYMPIIVIKYKCTECSRRFPRSCALAVHMGSHSGEELFECTVCSKQFTRSSHFVDHSRIHSGEKPYKCHVCDKACIGLGVWTNAKDCCLLQSSIHKLSNVMRSMSAYCNLTTSCKWLTRSTRRAGFQSVFILSRLLTDSQSLLVQVTVVLVVPLHFTVVAQFWQDLFD